MAIIERTPVVTVVMPVHNCVLYIDEAINSVLEQTYNSLELVIIDDGSTDGTRNVVEKRLIHDQRIRLFSRNQPSGSPAVPRNIGLDMARGKYVAFLDSDDIWYPAKLEKQIKFMLDKRAVVSYTGTERINEIGDRIASVQVPESLSYRDLLKNTAIVMSSAMVDWDVVGNERFVRQGHEDYEFWLRLVKRHGRCYGLNEILLKYRVVKGSVSSGRIRSALWVWRIYRKNESLSLLYAIWCLTNYGLRAMFKRL